MTNSVNMNDAISTTVDVLSLGEGGEHVRMVLYRGTIDGKTRYQAEVNKEIGEAKASVAAAINAAGKMFLGSEVMKSLNVKDVTAKWPTVGDNKPKEDDDWRKSENAKDVEAATNRAAALATEAEEAEVGAFEAQMRLAGAVAEVRKGLNGLQFANWKETIIDDEKTSPALRRLCGKDSAQRMSILLLIGSMPDDVRAAIPSSWTSASTVYVSMTRVRKAMAKFVYEMAERVASEDDEAIGVLHINNAALDFFEEDSLKLNDLTHDENAFAAALRNMHRSNLSEYVAAEADMFSEDEHGEISVRKVGNEGFTAYIAAPCLATNRAKSPDEFLDTIVKHANAQRKANAKRREEARAEAAEKEKKLVDHHAGEVKRRFADFTNEEAAMHLFTILAAKITTGGEGMVSVSDAYEVANLLADLVDRVKEGETVRNIVNDVPVFTENAGESDEAEAEEEADEEL